MNSKYVVAFLAILLAVPVSACMFCDGSDADSQTVVQFSKDEKTNLVAGTYDYDSPSSFKLRTPTGGAIDVNSGLHTIIIPISGAYSVDSSSYYPTTVSVTFSKDPRVPEAPCSPTEDAATHTVTTWAKLVLSAGEYRGRGAGIYIVENGSDNQARFEAEVVANDVKSFDPSEYGMTYLHGNKASFGYEVAAYELVSYVYGRTCTLDILRIGGDSEFYISDSAKPVFGGQYYSFYVSAYKSFTVGASSSDDSPFALCGSDGSMYYIASGMSYTIFTKAGTNYYLESLSSSDGPATIDFKVHVEGESPSDSLGMVFAALCVVLCAVIFGLMFRSGLKPSWATKD